MKRVDEYGPTAMERAEIACDNYACLIDNPPYTIQQHSHLLIHMNRAMLAAMREHNENMRRDSKVPS